MPDLTPADPADLVDALTFALKRRRDGRASRDHADPAARAAAHHIAEMLALSGFVVMKKPPAPAHGGVPTGHNPLDE